MNNIKYVAILSVLCLVLTFCMGCTTQGNTPATTIAQKTPLVQETVTLAEPASAVSPQGNASIIAQLAAVQSNNPVWLEAYRMFNNMKKTEYIHKTFVDESKGIYDFDCLGFVDTVLKNADPTAYAAISHNYAKPSIAQYAGYIDKLDPKVPNAAGWSRVTRPIDLKPGDVCLWLKPTTLDLGHMWIIAGKPTINPSQTNEVLVRILDSDGAHADDSRSLQKYKYGLGTGILGMMVDNEGTPIGLYWNTSASSLGELDTTIVCARLN